MKEEKNMNGLLAVLKMILTLFAKGAESSQVASEKKEEVKPQTTKPKTEPLFKNDSERLKNEVVQLSHRNPELHKLLYEICDYCKTEFNKNVVVTMIYRTDQEQAQIYKDDVKYKAKPFKSPHQFFHAFDLRSSSFDTKEIEKLVLWVNTTYNVFNHYNWTAKNHNVGLGDHFHVQFTKR